MPPNMTNPASNKRERRSMYAHDLFQDADVQQTRSQREAVLSATDDRVVIAAHRLAVRFTEDADLPARCRRRTDPSVKIPKFKEDSEIEKRFKANVESWRTVIETMIAKLDEGQAWRFINLRPESIGRIGKVIESQDFCDFIDYMILRRDKEWCGPDELGGLALLSVALQREVEKQIQG
ncbi:MAG: hypothetical protein NTY19_23715 [Planctomycetota bacterium]|nr:hypothetical protein [Planctomycetota bacterium]